MLTTLQQVQSENHFCCV